MEIQRVTVTNIEMSIWDMTVFMVKWAIAAIPAFIILMFLGALAIGFLSGLSQF